VFLLYLHLVFKLKKKLNNFGKEVCNEETRLPRKEISEEERKNNGGLGRIKKKKGEAGHSARALVTLDIIGNNSYRAF
jgi:hypothetical protein